MKKVQNFLGGMIVGYLVCVLAISLTSCASTGYGCKDRSKCMTRVTDNSPWKIR